MTTMNRLTLLDIAKRSDPDGKAATIIEVLNQVNPILQDAPASPSNAPTGNRVTVRSTLPTVNFRKINQGVTRSKSATRQTVDTIGFIDGRCEVDIRERKVIGDANFAAHKANENLAFVEAIGQKIAKTMIYGNELTEESSFTGLQPRLETAATAITGSQVAKHHTSPTGSDYTSIYIVDWSEMYVHLIYPRDGAGVAGLDVRNVGEADVYDDDSNPFRGDITIYEWLLGLTVKDPRHIARLANIDVSQALTDTSTLIKASLTGMLNGMPPQNGSNRVMYCSRNIKTAFENQVDAKSNVWFDYKEYLGERTLTFKGIPVRILDQISEAESLVT